MTHSYSVDKHGNIYKNGRFVSASNYKYLKNDPAGQKALSAAKAIKSGSTSSTGWSSSRGWVGSSSSTSKSTPTKSVTVVKSSSTPSSGRSTTTSYTNWGSKITSYDPNWFRNLPKEVQEIAQRERQKAGLPLRPRIDRWLTGNTAAVGRYLPLKPCLTA